MASSQLHAAEPCCMKPEAPCAARWAILPDDVVISIVNLAPVSCLLQLAQLERRTSVFSTARLQNLAVLRSHPFNLQPSLILGRQPSYRSCSEDLDAFHTLSLDVGDRELVMLADALWSGAFGGDLEVELHLTSTGITSSCGKVALSRALGEGVPRNLPSRKVAVTWIDTTDDGDDLVARALCVGTPRVAPSIIVV